MYWSGKRAHKNFKIVWKLFAEGLPGHFGFCRHRRWETVNTQCWSFACRSFSSLKRRTRLIRYCYFFFFSRDGVGGHGSKTCQRYQPKGPLCLSLSPLFTVNLLKLVLKSHFLLWMHSQKKITSQKSCTHIDARTHTCQRFSYPVAGGGSTAWGGHIWTTVNSFAQSDQLSRQKLFFVCCFTFPVPEKWPHCVK